MKKHLGLFLLMLCGLIVVPSGDVCWWTTQCSNGEAVAAEQITIELGGPPVVLAVNAMNKTLLTRLLTRENTRRAAHTPPLPALTLEAYVRDLIVDMVRGYKVQHAGQEHVDACTTFKAMTTAQQDTITASLGGSSPCP